MYNIEYLKKIVTNLEWLDNHATNETPEFLILKSIISELYFIDRMELLESILGRSNESLSLPYTQGHFKLFFDLNFYKINPISEDLIAIDQEENFENLISNFDEYDLQRAIEFDIDWNPTLQNIEKIETNNPRIKLKEKIIKNIRLLGDRKTKEKFSLKEIHTKLANIFYGLMSRENEVNLKIYSLMNYKDEFGDAKIGHNYKIYHNNKLKQLNIIELSKVGIYNLLNEFGLALFDELQDYKLEKLNLNYTKIKAQNFLKLLSIVFKDYLINIKIDFKHFSNYLINDGSPSIKKIQLNRSELLSILGFFLFLYNKEVFIKPTKIQLIRLIQSYFFTGISNDMLKKIFNQKSTYPNRNREINYNYLWNELSNP